MIPLDCRDAVVILFNLMWPFRRPSEAPPERVIERLEQLEDRYARLERRFVKLQGEFSAYMRDRYDELEDDDDVVE